MSTGKNMFSKIALHASLWILFIFLPALIIVPLVVICSEVNVLNAGIMVVVSSILLVVVFYYNYLFLFPKFYIPKKRFKYFIHLLLSVIIVSIVTKVFASKEISEQLLDNSRWKGIVVAVELFRLLLVILASCGLVMYEHWQRVEREKLKAEVSFLKAQINPHFLFNTLNGINALVLKKSDLAYDAVEKLSAIMRYTANESVKDKVHIENEIRYIADYIELQKLRLTEYTVVNFTADEVGSSLLIEPMLLISFVENAFKYGVSTQIKSTIDIIVTTNEKQFKLVVRNDKVRKQPVSTESGIGLENTIQRLRVAYPNMHTLHIENNEKEYKVELTLQLL